MRHLLLFLLLCTALPLTAAEEAAADTAQAQPQQEQPSQEQAQPQPQEQPPAEAAPQESTAQKEEPAKEGGDAQKEEPAKEGDDAKKDDGKKEGEEEGGDDDSGDSDGEFYIAAKAELGFGFSSVNDNVVMSIAPRNSMFDFEAGIGGEFGYKFWIPFEVGLGFAYRYRVLADGADLLNYGNGHSMLPYVAARFYIPLVVFDLYPDIRLGCDIHIGGDDTTIPLFYGSVGVGFLFLEYFLVEASYSFEIGNELTGANKIKNWQLNVFTIRGGVRF
jgi:hypothetical protein